ncbi:hypothetical protein DK26_04730 [Bosea sp. WAO]|nr:hypothetical protein DK26_04730 [Bosea sp. WAO]
MMAAQERSRAEQVRKGKLRHPFSLRPNKQRARYRQMAFRASRKHRKMSAQVEFEVVEALTCRAARCDCAPQR